MPFMFPAHFSPRESIFYLSRASWPIPVSPSWSSGCPVCLAPCLPCPLSRLLCERAVAISLLLLPSLSASFPPETPPNSPGSNSLYPEVSPVPPEPHGQRPWGPVLPDTPMAPNPPLTRHLTKCHCHFLGTRTSQLLHSAPGPLPSHL